MATVIGGELAESIKPPGFPTLDVIRFLISPRAAFADLSARLRGGERLSSESIFYIMAASGLLTDPPAVARALWGAWLRNPTALIAFLHLAMPALIATIVFTGAAALILRFAVSRFDLGQLFDLAAPANYPRAVVAIASSVAWALHAPLPVLDSLATAPVLTLTWLVLGWGGSLVWLWFAARATAAAPLRPLPLRPLPLRPLPLRLIKRFAHCRAGRGFLLVEGVAVPCWKLVHEREVYRPAGRGDIIGDFSARALDSGEIERFSFPRPRKMVIDFWATWCPPCRAALPSWQALQNEDADFVSLNLEPGASSDVHKFIRDNSYTFKVWQDTANLQGRLQIDTLPSIVVVGKDGHIERFWIGGAAIGTLRDAIRR